MIRNEPKQIISTSDVYDVKYVREIFLILSVHLVNGRVGNLYVYHFLISTHCVWELFYFILFLK